MCSHGQLTMPFTHHQCGFFIYEKLIIKSITLQIFFFSVTDKFIEKKTRYEYK